MSRLTKASATYSILHTTLPQIDSDVYQFIQADAASVRGLIQTLGHTGWRYGLVLIDGDKEVSGGF